MNRKVRCEVPVDGSSVCGGMAVGGDYRDDVDVIDVGNPDVAMCGFHLDLAVVPARSGFARQKYPFQF